MQLIVLSPHKILSLYLRLSLADELSCIEDLKHLWIEHFNRQTRA